MTTVELTREQFSKLLSTGEIDDIKATFINSLGVYKIEKENSCCFWSEVCEFKPRRLVSKTKVLNILNKYSSYLRIFFINNDV